MRVKRVLVVAIAVLLIALGACSPAIPERVSLAVSNEEFTQAQHITRQVEVAEGGSLIVVLASNPSAGFQWTEQAQIVDQTVLQQTGHRYIPPETAGGAPPLPGSPGNEEWTFKALKQGTTSVSLRYARPWQSDMGTWSFKLSVTVRPIT